MADIAGILHERGVRLKGGGGDEGLAAQREDLLRAIASDYPVFERVRDGVCAKAGLAPESLTGEAARSLLELLRRHWLVHLREGRFHAADAAARRFLTGGWLEELAWLAAMEAGADEALCSQVISWKVQDYYGENEIDVIVRKGERLGFISCKALQSRFNAENRKHRARLMEALHEADNLCDHFGRDGELAAVLVTTDLIDEKRRRPRYMALMGKAAALEVRVIPLEELAWEPLVAAIGEVVNGVEDGDGAVTPCRASSPPARRRPE